MYSAIHGYNFSREDIVLDLRVSKGQEDLAMGQLTPPRDEPCTSPTLAATQRVLAAAVQPNQGTRPFKAYPKDPLSMTGGGQDESYVRFREEMLSQVMRSGGKTGSAGAPSPLRKRQGSPQPSQGPWGGSSGGEQEGEKDAAYWERRRKNNEAAKRSRDARRAKEDEIAIRAAFLEQENLKLKYQVAALTEETSHLRCIVSRASDHHSIMSRFPAIM